MIKYLLDIIKYLSIMLDLPSIINYHYCLMFNIFVGYN
jgi:hypothetical protein